MSENNTNIAAVSAEEYVTTEKFKVSDLWKQEDWLAIWIGFLVIVAGAVSVLTGTFDFSAANFSTWGNGNSLLDQLNGAFLGKLFLTFVILAVLFTVGNVLKGTSAVKYLPAFLGLFVLAVIVRLISAEYTLNRYLEWAFWAIVVGLLVSNTVGVPKWLRPAVQTEFYIKAGLVIMGFSVLFSNIVNFGLYGLGIAWIVTPIVIIFMWYFGTRVLKIDNKPFVITIATATSVCGTSAAIASGAASKAKKTDLSLAVSISIIFTVIMMVFEPVIIRAVGLGEVMGGALIGGTVDSTGAVTVAGTALGETAQTVAVLVKSIQNILIGFIAFAVAVFFTTHVEKDSNSAQRVTAAEIWYRLPKFILGFFAASLAASFIVLPAAGSDAVSAINKVLDQYKNWAFVLAFTSIGLDTNFKEIKDQLQGGKPLVLYVVGQLFNIVLTFAAVYILLSGKFFPLPNIAL
ncbi:MAG: putative sulfate exporter family transporter [Lachnospiraceae bacterium]|nr:putative sulfate exporter family transporter [Lachnospiraceae bacterium]